MSYIDKNGNIVISARMTDKGREQLSIGQLNFTTFKLGDSEVDYSSLGSTYDITLENVLKSKASQPKAKTWLLPTTSNITGEVAVPPLTALEVGTIIDAPEKGFFSTGNTSGTTILTSFTAQTSDTYTVNEGVINLSDFTGGFTVDIKTGSTTGSYEPLVGDLMLVKFSTPTLTDPQIPYTVDLTTPVPYLWYKIQSTTGDMATNTLNVTVDRILPNFSSYGGPNTCDVMFYPTSGSTGSPLFGTNGYYSGGAVWNMNNVWSNDMAGINLADFENFTYYGSEGYVGTKEFFGYTSQLSGSCEEVRAISVIHYSNTESCDRQSELIYGQKFHIDLSLGYTPIVKIPTLMWHRSSGTTIGQTFSGTGLEKYVKQGTSNTDIRYFDMADEQGYVVGRIFPDQQVFTVHDDELVAGMSYKSNRNWTLPKLNLGLKSSNDGLIDNTQDIHITYLFNNTSSGFTAGIHSQYHSCLVVESVVDAEGNSCGDDQTKDVEITFPLSQLPFMTTTGSTGWYADQFIVLAQKVVSGQKPTTDGWVEIDMTSLIDNHTTGNIDPTNLESTTFVLTKALYDAGSTYSIHDYLNIPLKTEPSLLQFGDERFFYGNISASGINNKYRTKFNFTVPPTQWNTTNNPTWGGSGQNPHISEVIVYDNQGNVVAVGKQNLPIEKTNNTTIIIEIAFDM